MGTYNKMMQIMKEVSMELKDLIKAGITYAGIDNDYQFINRIVDYPDSINEFDMEPFDVINHIRANLKPDNYKKSIWYAKIKGLNYKLSKLYDLYGEVDMDTYLPTVIP
jgi:hypothetical protein